MEYFQLNGSQVSRIGLGTWAIGGREWGDVADHDAVATCLSIDTQFAKGDIRGVDPKLQHPRFAQS